MTAMLEVRSISKRFGGLIAVDDVTLDAPAGQITALIGPNGAGKTTLFNCVTGRIRPDDGRILLGGSELTALSVADRSLAGLGRTFQRLEVFSGITVADNLRVAADASRSRSLIRELLGIKDPTRADAEALVRGALAATGLLGQADRVSGTLSTGSLRRLEVARALCTSPRALLLDEPASGLDPAETEELGSLLRRLVSDGLAVLLIEHDIDLVAAISDHLVVLDRGAVIASGEPRVVLRDPVVRAAYLGTVEAVHP